MRSRYAILILVLFFSACAKIEKKSIIIDTIPQGATIVVSEIDEKSNQAVEKEIGISPIEYEISLPKTQQVTETPAREDIVSQPTKIITEPKYTIMAAKDGYFNEISPISDYDQLLESGRLEISLQESPLWAATENSNATNQWMNLIVNKEISDVDMWQRVVDAVTRRFQELKEYDFTSGYLVSLPKIKKFETSRGVFLLRTKFLATVMERNPLTYRLKIESHWSDIGGNKWNLYPRVFKEDAELVTELMERFQEY